ncbi:hypothetical protein Tcan_09255 [Toxocara canis]|uniref:Uncharacterized protein n=1 Tax=Toxocara canis TaxID=6265 RepID=A0A0B2VFJ5_TOXCA|nr:hypothetical protein Tcan_09255 [Toxocara canis]
MVVSFSQIIEQILSQHPEEDNQLDQLAEDIVEGAERATEALKRGITKGFITILSGTERALKRIEEGSVMAQSKICYAITILNENNRSQRNIDESEIEIEQVDQQTMEATLATNNAEMINDDRIDTDPAKIGESSC